MTESMSEFLNIVRIPRAGYQFVHRIFVVVIEIV